MRQCDACFLVGQVAANNNLLGKDLAHGLNFQAFHDFAHHGVDNRRRPVQWCTSHFGGHAGHKSAHPWVFQIGFTFATWDQARFTSHAAGQLCEEFAQFVKFILAMQVLAVPLIGLFLCVLNRHPSALNFSHFDGQRFTCAPALVSSESFAHGICPLGNFLYSIQRPPNP